MPGSPSPIYLDDEQLALFDDIAKRNGVETIRRKRRHLIAFGWYGGKYSHLDWLLPLLPKCLAQTASSPRRANFKNRPVRVRRYAVQSAVVARGDA